MGRKPQIFRKIEKSFVPTCPHEGARTSTSSKSGVVAGTPQGRAGLEQLDVWLGSEKSAAASLVEDDRPIHTKRRNSCHRQVMETGREWREMEGWRSYLIDEPDEVLELINGGSDLREVVPFSQQAVGDGLGQDVLELLHSLRERVFGLLARLSQNNDVQSLLLG